MVNNSVELKEILYVSSEAPAQKMTGDVLDVVGKELSLLQLTALTRVCKLWEAIIQPKVDRRLLEEVSFGKKKWLNIPGVEDVSDEYALTEDQKKAIITKLKGNCEFFNITDSKHPHRFQNKKIKKTWQTHLLMFFPEKINKAARTIDSQNHLFHFIKEVDNGKAYYCFDGVEEEACKQPDRSYWALITLDVIPESRDTTQETKKNLLECKGYRIPTLNEAITSNLIMNLEASKLKKDYFFGMEQGGSWTFTATEELHNEGLAVGGTGASGLRVLVNRTSSKAVGAAGVMEVPIAPLSSEISRIQKAIFGRFANVFLKK